MVRRWSYLNLINSARAIDLAAYHILRLPTFFEALFKATTYYYKPLFSDNLSKLVRKSFARLRHITNFFIYQNLLVNWSQEYIFLKNSIRLNLSIRFHKYNYFTNVSPQFFGKDEKALFNYTPFLVWTLRGAGVRSSSYLRTSNLDFFTQVLNLNNLIISSPSPVKLREDLSYWDTGSLSRPAPPHLKVEPFYEKVITLILQLYFTSLIPLYRIFILTLL